MPSQRLARVSEINEEGSENEADDSALDPKNKNRANRNSNQLHVTINTKPEEIDCDGNSSQHSNGTTGSNRRPSVLIQEILSTRRPSAIMAAIRSPKQFVNRYRRESTSFDNMPDTQINENALLSMKKNRRFGDDALSSALSALYAKIIVIVGIALPVTEVLTSRIPSFVYQSFYVYLYIVSILFVIFVYSAHMRTRAVLSLIKTYHEKTNNDYSVKKRTTHFGSFYLRVGAISFGIGTMVYTGLEIGQYFELNRDANCTTFMMAVTPIARMLLSIIQMQFIFLNTTDLDMGRHKVVSRFGLMHMVATNLCEWLYVLVEETKHEIHHFQHIIGKTMNVTPLPSFGSYPQLNVGNEGLKTVTHIPGESERMLTKRHSDIDTDCSESTIMTTLIHDASPFLFPCTIEYSLICAVILYEMWKNVKSIPNIERHRRNSVKPNVMPQQVSAHQFSVDCSRAHRGMFGGIMVIVLTIICLIMYFVLRDVPDYEKTAIGEVVYCEMILYVLTTLAVLSAVFTMRDLKFLRKTNDHHGSTVALDCTLLVLAQTGVYLYGSFSIIGCYFAMLDDVSGSAEGLLAEMLCLMQTSLQTLFILNASWRRCKGSQQNRNKPGREMVTFLLVANMSLWFIFTLIKSRAGFRPTHLDFYGVWAWTVITHATMPLAIFYRFHSSICLFEIWKSVYKTKEH
ncbi:proton channel OtopLc-like isoform X2 [Contarinia nasturtii]|nr:proton channel OtopLc-like isoform X2 [Contarinia nasturtii]